MPPAVARTDSIQLTVAGPFDLPASLRVARALADAAEETLVQVDLTRVSHFEDRGVAVLARALAGHPRTLVRGLRRHQVRLLRYFGVHGFGDSMVDAEPAWSS